MAAKQRLIDVRNLVDRLDAFGTRALAACRNRRVAVIDSGEHSLDHSFSEYEARRRGYELRYFTDATSAMEWLHAEH